MFHKWITFFILKFHHLLLSKWHLHKSSSTTHINRVIASQSSCSLLMLSSINLCPRCVFCNKYSCFHFSHFPRTVQRNWKTSVQYLVNLLTSSSSFILDILHPSKYRWIPHYRKYSNFINHIKQLRLTCFKYCLHIFERKRHTK